MPLILIDGNVLQRDRIMFPAGSTAVLVESGMVGFSLKAGSDDVPRWGKVNWEVGLPLQGLIGVVPFVSVQMWDHPNSDEDDNELFRASMGPYHTVSSPEGERLHLTSDLDVLGEYARIVGLNYYVTVQAQSFNTRVS